MKRITRHFIAFLVCAATLAICLPMPSAETVWFSAINDSVLDFTKKNRPVKDQGETFVTLGALTDSDSDIGIEWKWNPYTKRLTLTYNGKGVAFLIGKDIAVDMDNVQYTQRCMIYKYDGYNETYLIPIAFLCTIFEWTYKEVTTDFGTMLRIKTRSCIREDVFLSARESVMREKYNAYLSLLSPASPSPSASPTLPGTVSPTPGKAEPGVTYLTFSGKINGNTAEILRLLDENNIKAAFFVTAEDSVHPKELRHMAARHVLGLTVSPENESSFFNSTEEMLGLLDTANAILIEAALTRSRLVRIPESSLSLAPAFRTELVNNGYRFWDATVLPAGSSSKMLSIIRSAVSDAGDDGLPTIISLDYSAETLKMLPELIDQFRSGELVLKVICPAQNPVNDSGDLCIPAGKI